jgi:hypothetical protein
MKRAATVLALFAVTIPFLVSCVGEETPEQRLARLRARHEIFPAGVASVTGTDGAPAVVVDVQVANQGTEPLSSLTVLATIRGGDGADKLMRRITLDLEGLRPGVGERRTAMISGAQLAEGDEVFIEIEANLPAEELRSLPEWSEVAGSS